MHGQQAPAIPRAPVRVDPDYVRFLHETGLRHTEERRRVWTLTRDWMLLRQRT